MVKTWREHQDAMRAHREAAQKKASEEAYAALISALSRTRNVMGQTSEVLYILNSLYAAGYNAGIEDHDYQHRENLRRGGANVW